MTASKFFVRKVENLFPKSASFSEFVSPWVEISFAGPVVEEHFQWKHAKEKVLFKLSLELHYEIYYKIHYFLIT